MLRSKNSHICCERELVFTFAICYLPSVCRLSVCCLSVCRLSVTLVRSTQAVEIFRNVSPPFGTLATVDVHVKFTEIVPGTPPAGGLNARGVVKYSEGYILETVQDRKQVSINH